MNRPLQSLTSIRKVQRVLKVNEHSVLREKDLIGAFLTQIYSHGSGRRLKSTGEKPDQEIQSWLRQGAVALAATSPDALIRYSLQRDRPLIDQQGCSRAKTHALLHAACLYIACKEENARSSLAKSFLCHGRCDSGGNSLTAKWRERRNSNELCHSFMDLCEPACSNGLVLETSRQCLGVKEIVTELLSFLESRPFCLWIKTQGARIKPLTDLL